jgi:hypothetical protein
MMQTDLQSPSDPKAGHPHRSDEIERLPHPRALAVVTDKPLRLFRLVVRLAILGEVTLCG